MPVHEFIQLWRTEYYAKNLHVCLIIIPMTLQIYKSWGLMDSTKTTTGACITQNQKDWKRRKLKHKHGHSHSSTTLSIAQCLPESSVKISETRKDYSACHTDNKLSFLPQENVKRKSDDKKSDHTTISRKVMRHALRKLKNQKAKHEDASTKAALGGPAADEEAGKTPVVNVAQNPTALAAAGNLNRVLSESIGKLSSASQQMNSALNGGNGGPMGDARPPVVQSQGPPLHCPSPCSQACAPQGCNPSCCMSQVPMQMPMQMPQMMPMPMPQMMPQMMPQPMPYQMPMYSAPCQPPACQSYYPPPPPPPPPLQITVSKPRIFALPPPPPPAMLCPGMCQQQCAPSCPHSCCGPAPPAQLMANQCPPICAQQCAPQCAHACCGPSQQMMPQPMQMPMPMPQPMPMQMPMPMAGGCSPACQPQSCQPGCPPMCCGAGRR